MAWTVIPDNVARCGDDPGPVAPGEVLICLVHSKLDIDVGVLFKRETLLPKKNESFSNVCGESDGQSVVRRGQLSDQRIFQMSEDQAAVRPGRTARGARLAMVDDVRAIGITAASPSQKVYVYDDPVRPTNPLHAVMRVDGQLAEQSRAEFDSIRVQIEQAFSTRISLVTP